MEWQWGAKQWKSKKEVHSKGSSESSSSSGESSNEDYAHRDESYWKVGAGISGLPYWISKKREGDAPSACEVWGEKRAVGRWASPRMKDFEAPPGGAFV